MARRHQFRVSLNVVKVVDEKRELVPRDQNNNVLRAGTSMQ